MKKTIFIVLTTLVFTFAFTGCGKRAESGNITPTPTDDSRYGNSSGTPAASVVVTETTPTKSPEDNTITPVVTGGGADDNTPTGLPSVTPLPTVTPEVTVKPEEWKPRDERFIITPAAWAENYPEGMGNVEIPRGSAEYFLNLPYYYYREIDDRVFAIEMFNTSEDEYNEMCNVIRELDGIKEGPIAVYYHSGVFLEAYTDDVSYGYLRYLRDRYPDYFIREDVVRIPIVLYTYEGCDEFIMYHGYVSNYQWGITWNEFFEEEYYLSEYYTLNTVYKGRAAHLAYAAGDSLKIVNYANIGRNYFGDVLKKLNYEAVLDDYRVMPPEWFLEMQMFDLDEYPLALTVPYDFYMDYFAWEINSSDYYCVVKCSETIDNPGRWASVLSEKVMHYNYSTVSDMVFFKHDLSELLY